jgi:2-polyprenyl-6-methoxyphenol hydroxylase-like FAD-dependent oxidoreductase
MKTDVLIVGAGPTGLALACQLIRYGVDFVIIDKKETTTPYSKAIGVQARTLEIYEQIGLAEKLSSLGAIANGAKLFAGGKLRGEIDFTDIGKGMTPYPGVLIVEQGKHESLLYEYIISHGLDVRWRSELADFTQNENGVTANIRSAAGSTEAIQAKFMVACDGAKSSARHALGLKFAGSTFDRMFYVADVDIDWPYGTGGLFAFLMRHNLLVFFTMDGERRYRIVGTFPEEFAKDEGDVLYEEIEEQIRKDAEIDFDITKVHWFSTYNVHTRHVDEFSVGRCFLAGDAAHIHSPAGAQGMNTGIQDGYNLAWKLAWVLKGNARPELLDTYNEERLPNAENLTRTTDRFFGLVADPNPFAAFVRLHIFPMAARFISRLKSVRRFVFPRIAQLKINYRSSSLSKNDGAFKVKAGDRMPYFQVYNQSVYDRMRDAKFHVLVFGGDGFAKVSEDLEDVLDIRNLALTTEVEDIFGSDNPFILVVRPDNYIGLISEKVSLESVRSYLENVTGN